MTAVQRISGWRSRATLLLILVGLATVLTTGTASAHAFLDHSDPEANAVVPAPPAQIQMWFTEPVEPKYSYAQLFDSNGKLVTTPESQVGGDQKLMTLPLPADLAKGTYTIQYRNVSAADGHPNAGYVPFTIGGQADVVVPGPPPSASAGDPPIWLNTLGRWLSLLGVTGAVGALLCWRWVILPSIAGMAGTRRDAIIRAIRALALAGVATGSIGSLIALVVQAMSVARTASITSIVHTLRDTNYGHLWLVRILLLVVLGAILSRRALWNKQLGGRSWNVATVIAILALAPYALISHAAAQPTGKPAAMAADWLHLLATSAWVGGLLALVVALVFATRGTPVAQRRAVYAAAIPRFSTLAIASVVILALTGFYASWLEIGNLPALLGTSYGRTLLVKLGLLVPLILLGAINLRVIGPRLQRNAARTGTRFGRTVAAEALLAIAILIVVGVLTSLPTAREVMAAQVGQTSFHVFDQGVHATLRVAPAAVGVNRYDADIGLEKGELPADTAVLLRVSRQGDIEGIREITLNKTEVDHYSASGSELSVVGSWQLELLVRRPGESDFRATMPIEIGKTPPEARVPGPPPRFSGILAAAGMLTIAGAVMALVIAFRRRKGKRMLAELGTVLILISVVALGTTRISQTANADVANPIPVSAASVAAGETTFQANCTVCHGANGRGDGPMAQTLNPPPADLTASHVDAHTDGDIYGWIKDGYPDSAMPGFSDKLNETEMWQLVNYARSLRHPVADSTP